MTFECTTCGSTDVACEAFVSVNSGEVVARFDNHYCYECERECSIEEV